MAQRIEVQLIDDLDGSQAVETITFGFNGVDYAIDLNEENANRLTAFLSIHADVARKVGGKKARGKGAYPVKITESQTIREWIRSQGEQISDRGRIPNRWVEEYHAAQKSAQEPSQAQEEAPVMETPKPKTNGLATRNVFLNLHKETDMWKSAGEQFSTESLEVFTDQAKAYLGEHSNLSHKTIANANWVEVYEYFRKEPVAIEKPKSVGKPSVGPAATELAKLLAFEEPKSKASTTRRRRKSTSK